jgi:hypothetical protein
MYAFPHAVGSLIELSRLVLFVRLFTRIFTGSFPCTGLFPPPFYVSTIIPSDFDVRPFCRLHLFLFRTQRPRISKGT